MAYQSVCNWVDVTVTRRPCCGYPRNWSRRGLGSTAVLRRSPGVEDRAKPTVHCVGVSFARSRVRVEALMEAFLHQVFSGLATGGIYASLALALVMIYQSTHHINFAQGEMAMFSTYLAWSLVNAGVP